MQSRCLRYTVDFFITDSRTLDYNAYLLLPWCRPELISFRIATSNSRLQSRSLYYDDDDDDDDADDAHADDDDDHSRVACYPRAPVSHVIPGRACHMLPWAARCSTSEKENSTKLWPPKS